MKKLFFLFFLMVLPMLVEPVSALRIMGFKVPEYACGTILFMDGREETFRWVEIPTKVANKISVSNEESKSNKEHFEAQDIRCITFWNEKFPDKKTTLYHLKCISDWGKKPSTLNLWGIGLQENSWGAMYICYSEYKVNKKTGEFETYTIVQNNIPDDPVVLIESHDFQDARYLGRYASHTNRKTGKTETMVYGWAKKYLPKIAAYFASKPEIESQIVNGTLTGADFLYIFDQMGQ